MSLEYEIKNLLKTGFKIKGNVIVKLYNNGITTYTQHLVKYDSK